MSKFPQFPEVVKTICIDSLDKVIKAIHGIDMTIHTWNDILERAQPLISGRLVIRFIDFREWLYQGKVVRTSLPVVGKMIKFPNGHWKFYKLDTLDVYEHLSDLRVGKSYSSDALVKRLIDGIELLLKDRVEMEAILRELRIITTNRCKSVSTQADKMFDMSPRLRARIKNDWKENAQGSLKATQEFNRARNQAKSARKNLPSAADL